MESLLPDLRYAMRSLRRSPGFTAVAIVTLALGIGANTAIFSVVDKLLFNPFPFLDSSRLVAIWQTAPRGANDHNEVTGADLRDYRAQLQSFEHVVGHTWWTANFTGGVEPERIQGFRVSPDYFDALGVRPAIGRTFAAGDDEPGKDRLVVLSDGLWRRRFGANQAIIGSTVAINGIEREIIGVMPPGVRYPSPAEAWAPLSLSADAWANRRAHYILVTGRLKEGVTLDAARAELAALGARISAEHPATSTGWGTAAFPLLQDSTRMIRPMLLVLFGAVGFVLLIACANVANLLLARAGGRRREMAIRTALGAARHRISRLVLTESLVLALAGGVAGAVVGVWGVDLLVSLVPAQHQRFMAGFDQVRVDGLVLAFTFVLSLISAVIFGLLPALRTARADGADPLRTGAATGGRERHRLRRALVGAEVALALLLLVGAGLTFRTFRYLASVDPGFNGDGVALTSMVLPSRLYPGDSAIVPFTTGLLSRVAALPGVTAAGISNIVPQCQCNSTTSFAIIGAEPWPAGERPDVDWRVVSPGYFAALRIPLVQGRLLEDGDGRGGESVMLVNEALSRRWFPEGAVGRMLLVDGDTTRPTRVVGVVGDIRHDGVSRPPRPQVYLPATQRADQTVTIFARTTADPVTLLPALRRVVRELDADQPVYDQTTMRAVMDLAVGPYTFSMRLLAGLGVVALLLAAVGIYGVIAHLVAERTREIGIRIALGGNQATVRGLVVRQGMMPAVAGLIAGVIAGLGLTQVMSRMMVGVSPRDPLTFGAVVVLLAGVALLACWAPAHRAAKVDPMAALRND